MIGVGSAVTRVQRPVGGCVVLIAALVIAAAGCGGDGSSGTTETPFVDCGASLAPITDEPVTASSFQTADQGLATVIELAIGNRAGDAKEAFFAQVHDLSHDIDRPLRQVDQSLAVQLCDEIVAMEQQFGQTTPNIAVLVAKATSLRQFFIDAAQALAAEPT